MAMIPAGSSVPVQFIRCTEEDIRKICASIEAQKETEIKINLNLDKEPGENPVENFIKELEKVSI